MGCTLTRRLINAPMHCSSATFPGDQPIAHAPDSTQYTEPPQEDGSHPSEMMQTGPATNNPSIVSAS
jgi:hypothetical protein